MNELAPQQNYEGGFMTDNTRNDGGGALAKAQESKSVQEIQAALTIAQKFPRNQATAYQAIMESCKRKFLAEQAVYAYPRGTQTVSGPSIRLAEVLAQNWGNMDFGIKELESKDGFSVVEAFAWDMQTNTRNTKIFHVPHIRYSKKFGNQKLTDPRDIYELIANQGARRLRACILAVIPGDITEEAVNACERTMASDELPKEDRIRKLINAFKEVDVKVEHLEKRLNHKMDATSEAELVTLRNIYKSLKDGFAAREDFFDIGGPVVEGEGGIKDLISNKAKPKMPPVTNAPVDKETGEVYEKK